MQNTLEVSARERWSIFLFLHVSGILFLYAIHVKPSSSPTTTSVNIPETAQRTGGGVSMSSPNTSPTTLLKTTATSMSCPWSNAIGNTFFRMLPSKRRWYEKSVLAEIVVSARPVLAIDVEWMNTNLGNEAISVSIVNYNLQTVFNSLLRPDGRQFKFIGTHIHGLRVRDVMRAPPRAAQLAHIYNLLQPAILIGHSIEGDLKAIQYPYEACLYDISKCPHVRDALINQHAIESGNFQKVSLKRMVGDLLGKIIQYGFHSSMEDAITTMMVFKKIIRI